MWRPRNLFWAWVPKISRSLSRTGSNSIKFLNMMASSFAKRSALIKPRLEHHTPPLSPPTVECFSSSVQEFDIMLDLICVGFGQVNWEWTDGPDGLTGLSMG